MKNQTTPQPGPEELARADFDAAWNEAAEATAHAPSYIARRPGDELNGAFLRANATTDPAARLTEKAAALRKYAAAISPAK